MGLLDEYLVEAIVNGLLFGGVLALLALGLNLIFGVIDVVWICYAELVMLGMYAMYVLYVGYGVPAIPAAIIAVLLVAALGLMVHVLVISQVIAAAPINQLLATGGLLFFLQSVATLIFGIEFKNLGLRLPILQVGDIYFSFSRLLAFGVAAVAMVCLYLFLTRTHMGRAMRAIAQDREIMVLMGVETRRIYIAASLIGGALAGLAATLLMLQYDVQPHVGQTFGPITFIICALGGLGNMLGGFVAAFLISEIIAIGGLYSEFEWGYVYAFTFFILIMFLRPQGLLGSK